MNQSAQRVIFGFVTVQNCFHFLPVRELDFSPGGEGDQQGHEISSHLFLRLHQVLFEVTNVSERESVPGLAAAVNLLAGFVVFMQEPQSDVGRTFDAFADAVASTKGADGIKTFQARNPADQSGGDKRHMLRPSDVLQVSRESSWLREYRARWNRPPAEAGWEAGPAGSSEQNCRV